MRLEQANIYIHIEAKIEFPLEMMSKIKEFMDRIEHLENAFIASGSGQPLKVRSWT